MNVNKNTWHFQLFEYAMKREKCLETVCSYLRGVLFGILKVLVIAIIVAFVIFGMTNWPVLMLTGVLLSVPLMNVILVAINILSGLIAWLVLIAFGIYTVFKYLKTKESLVESLNKVSTGISNTYEAINIPPIKKGSFIDILRVWIKNKHDKICTIVTFTKD